MDHEVLSRSIPSGLTLNDGKLDNNLHGSPTPIHLEAVPHMLVNQWNPNNTSNSDKIDQVIGWSMSKFIHMTIFLRDYSKLHYGGEINCPMIDQTTRVCQHGNSNVGGSVSPQPNRQVMHSNRNSEEWTGG